MNTITTIKKTFDGAWTPREYLQKYIRKTNLVKPLTIENFRG